jgi:tetratricopeptide (TPR) repeat protein
LAEWDREIAEREKRMQRDLRKASRERAFQLHVELGLTYGRRGRFDDALREFDAAAALRPEASDVHVLRGLTFETASKPDEARRAFRTAWERDRQHPVKAYYALRDSTGREREGPRKTLNDVYQELISRPAPAEPRGSLFVPMGAINEQLWSGPIVGDAELAEGFSRLAAGDYTGAIVALRRPTVTTDSPLASFTTARRLEAEGRIAEARRGYEMALAGTVAGHSRIYVAIGRLAQVDGDLPGAIAAFRRAVRLNPNDGVMHRELALALAAESEHDEAFIELVAALVINPGDASALASIGQLFLDMGRYADPRHGALCRRSRRTSACIADRAESIRNTLRARDRADTARRHERGVR